MGFSTRLSRFLSSAMYANANVNSVCPCRGTGRSLIHRCCLPAHCDRAPAIAGPLQHPQLCIDAVEAGVRNGGRAGLQAEADAFAKAASLPVHKALVHMFFAQRTTKNVRPAAPPPPLPWPCHADLLHAHAQSHTHVCRCTSCKEQADNPVGCSILWVFWVTAVR